MLMEYKEGAVLDSTRAAESFFMTEYVALRDVMRDECLRFSTKAALRAQSVAVPGKRKREYEAAEHCKRICSESMDKSS